MSSGKPLERREFLRIAAGGAGLLATGGLAALGACDRPPFGVDRDDGAGSVLRLPGSVSAAGLSLLAAPGVADIGAGSSRPAWLFNDMVPGPTVRARRGDEARITLFNHLPEETIVHWHGLIVPEEADGHPRYAIPPGATYDYVFPILQRAGTSWYHPHAHHRTAAQIGKGLAGFFIVSDDEEDALRLPDGPREIPIIVQDRRGDAGFSYSPSADDLVTGTLGDTVFCNGVRSARLRVTADTYRFRILNASHSRVYRLALSSGAPLTVIGNDGGLLPTAADVDSAFLGVGERLDFLVDFSGLEVGRRLKLESLPFAMDGMAGNPFPQGLGLDILELEVHGEGRREKVVLPSTLSSVPPLPAAGAVERTFDFSSTAGAHHEMHRINDLSFDMLRIDERVPLGRAERWSFRNHSALPHPVHLHGTHF